MLECLVDGLKLVDGDNFHAVDRLESRLLNQPEERDGVELEHDEPAAGDDGERVQNLENNVFLADSIWVLVPDILDQDRVSEAVLEFFHAETIVMGPLEV